MDDLEPVPAEDLPDQEVPAADLPDAKAAGAEVPSDDLPSELQPAATTSTLGAGIEGIAKGFAGPLATGAELGLSKMGVPGLSAAEQEQREKEHPYAHYTGEAAGLIIPAMFTLGASAEARAGLEVGGLGLGTLAGGQGELIGAAGKAAAAAAKSVGLQKTGQTAIKLGIEGGLFHLSDNVSKMILGQTDPEAPVASLLAGSPEAILLGGLLGGVGGKAAEGLQNLAKGKLANALSRGMAELGSRFDLISKYGGLEGTSEAGADQAQHLYDTVSAAVDGGFSLKQGVIDKLTADIPSDKVSEYIASTMRDLQGGAKPLTEDGSYQDLIKEWLGKVMPGEGKLPAAGDVFRATDELKQELQHWSSYEKRLADPRQRRFVFGARDMASKLRDSLENSDQWGEMGNFQKRLNSAFSEMQAPLKSFKRAALSDVGGELQVNKGKIFNVFKQLGRGKLSADAPAQNIANFFDPAKKMLQTVADLHAEHGMESGIPPVPTGILDEMLNREAGKGAHVASWLYDAGQSTIGMAISHVIGTAGGFLTGHPYLGYRAGETLYPLAKAAGRKPTTSVVSAILRLASSGSYDEIPAAVNYAEGIKRGAARVEGAINNVFRVGGKTVSEAVTDAQREALKNFVAEGKLNQEIENQKNEGNQKPNQTQETPAFAHGGEVLAPELAPTPKKHAPKATKGMGKLSAVFPEQAMMLGMAKGRVSNYLNSVRPGAAQFRAPFDEDMPDKEHDRKYNRAIDIAASPLSVLDHIKKGTLEPEHVQHLNGLYPELANHLKKKLTEKITEAQMKNEKPPYHVRQGLSLLMGSTLDSNLSPQNIQAAQMTFQAQKANAQAAAPMAQKPKKGTASLENEPNQYRTSQQAGQLRQNHLKP